MINKTNNGMLLYCAENKFFQLSFGNLLFNLNTIEYQSLLSYLDKVDCNYWEEEYKNSLYNRKIPLPTLQPNLVILLSKSEVCELQNLLNCKVEQEILRPFEIGYPIFYN